MFAFNRLYTEINNNNKNNNIYNIIITINSNIISFIYTVKYGCISYHAYLHYVLWFYSFFFQ